MDHRKNLLRTIVAALLLSTAGLGVYALTTEPKKAGSDHHEHADGEAEDPGDEGHDEADHQHELEENAREHSHEDDRNHSGGDDHSEEGALTLDAAQIAAAKIQLVKAGPGTLTMLVQVPGSVVAHGDHLAHVTAKTDGTVAEVRRNLGATVKAGEVLAVLESAALAKAKSDYLTAARSETLASTTASREEALWRKGIAAELDYLNAKAAAAEAGFRATAARQKLAVLGIDAAALMQGSPQDMRLQPVRSPIAGRVIARNATRGAAVQADTELFTIADLSKVWLEMALSAGDLAFVREGAPVRLKLASGEPRDGTIVFVSPALDAATRIARAVAEVDNADGMLRPGDFTAATISANGGQAASVVVPAEAVHTIKGNTGVFVRTKEGFAWRIVSLGRTTEQQAEVIDGLKPGEEVAATGSFTLKAELGKAEAEHEH